MANLIEVAIEAVDAASPVFAAVAAEAEAMGAALVEAAGGEEAVTAGTQELAAALAELQTVMAEMAAEAEAMVATLSGTAETEAALGAGAEEAAAGQETLAASMAGTAEASAALGAGADEAAAGQDALAVSLAETGTAAEGLAATVASVATEETALGTAGTEAAVGQQALAAASGEAAAAQGALAESTSGANLAQVALKGATSETRSAMDLLTGSALGAEAGVAGVALGLGISAKEAAGFQTELVNVQNNANMTDQQMQTMRDTVLTLGEESGQSLDGLAQGFMHAADISHSTAAAIGELTVANEAAVASGDNVEQTTNLLANVMHEFSRDTGDATTVMQNAAQVMGIMHLAASDSNMTLQQFTENSGRVMGVAANLGVPLEQVSAAFAALTLHGFDAAQAQTQLVDVMQHMIKPSQAQATEIERLSKLTGVDLVSDFSAAGLQGKGLSGVMDDLHDAYQIAGYGAADQYEETMKLINAQRGGLGLAVLLGTGQQDYGRILDDVSNTQKTATITQDQYNRTMDTAGQQFKVAKTNAHEFAITLGDLALPAINSGLKGLTDELRQDKDLLQGLTDTAHALGNIKLPFGADLGTTAGQAFSTAFNVSLLNLLNPMTQIKLGENLVIGVEGIARSLSDGSSQAQQYSTQVASFMTHMQEDFTAGADGLQQAAAITRQSTSEMTGHLEAQTQAHKDVAAAEQEQVLQSAHLMTMLDENTAKMARLKEINEGVAVTMQTTTRFELAQIEATSALKETQLGLAGAYQTGLGVMSDFNRQAGEYKGEEQAIAAAVKIVQEKQKEGIPLSLQEKTLLADNTELLKRLTGGEKDAAEQAGLAAAANVELMKAQDTLNDMLRHGITSGADYDSAVKKVKDATQEATKLGLDPAAQAADGMGQALSGLQGVVEHTLVPALDHLSQVIHNIPDKTVTVTADTKPALIAAETVNNTNIKNKNFEIDGDGTKAWTAMDKVEDRRVNNKSFQIAADNSAALQATEQVNSTNIKDKNLEITGDNAKAFTSIEQVEQHRVENKTFQIAGENAAALQAAEQVNNTNIHDKNFEIVANDSPAIAALTAVEQFVLHDKTVTITTQTQNIGEAPTAFAGGTGPGGASDTMVARVNDGGGPELIVYPYAGAFAQGGTIGIANGGRDGLTLLPKGAQVIPADQTQQILSGGVSLPGGFGGMSPLGPSSGAAPVTIHLGGITINGAGVSEPRELAKMIRDELQDAFSEATALASSQRPNAPRTAPGAL